MGFAGLSLGHLLVVLVIVVLVFGTKRLKTLGSDLGGALKGFKNAMSDEKKDGETTDETKRAVTDANQGHASQTHEKVAEPVKPDSK